MKEIKLTNGLIAMVDDEDYPLLSRYKWFHSPVSHLSYAQTYINQKTCLMHRLILNPPRDKIVDHIDWNGLNNQKSNIRICTHEQNVANRRIPARNGYYGIDFGKRDQLWRVRVKNKYYGSFKYKIEAARHYDKVVKEIYGEFAILNFK